MAGPALVPYTSVFRADSSHRVKRNRQPVSCTACQRRKSKCDRQQPCSGCEARGSPEKCRFGASPAAPAVGAVGVGGKQEVQARLTKLEEIVKGLAGDECRRNGKPSKVKDGPDVAMDSVSSGSDDFHVDRTDEEDHYGATCWAALVEGIHDIQTLLGEYDQPSVKPAPPPMPECFFASPKPITRKEIMDGLPSRQDADRLIAAYFNAKYVTVLYIHTHQFRRAYEAFWDRGAACYLWVSILFSILAIATSITQLNGAAGVSEAESGRDPRTFMILATRCYTAGEYARAKPFSVEALLIHAHSRFVCMQDSDPTALQFHALITRIAQRQGLHREAASTGHKVTPFEAEMRRRVWFTIQSVDLMHSFHNGMPPIIDDAVCDTLPPTNLTDDDFDEDSVTLPPARPTTDPIPPLVYIIKGSMCKVLRKVLRHVLSVSPRPYSETMALHHELEECYAAVPPCLRHRSIRGSSFTDQNYTILHRIMIEVIYHKTLCLLHRQYLSVEKHNPLCDLSRKTCRDAAVKLLSIQIELDQECQPGGRLYVDRHMPSALTMHHFLVAAMVICLDLSEGISVG